MTKRIQFHGETTVYECELGLDCGHPGWVPIAGNPHQRFFAADTENDKWVFLPGGETDIVAVPRLPLDSARRKEVPLWTFISTYFPKTFVALASLSYKANQKHNPGSKKMFWSREKSSDHKDCIARHLLDEGRVDPETNEPEAVAAAWRACANAEIVIEKLMAEGKYHV